MSEGINDCRSNINVKVQNNFIKSQQSVSNNYNEHLIKLNNEMNLAIDLNQISNKSIFSEEMYSEYIDEPQKDNNEILKLDTLRGE